MEARLTIPKFGILKNKKQIFIIKLMKILLSYSSIIDIIKTYFAKKEKKRKETENAVWEI